MFEIVTDMRPDFWILGIFQKIIWTFTFKACWTRNLEFHHDFSKSDSNSICALLWKIIKHVQKLGKKWSKNLFNLALPKIWIRVPNPITNLNCFFILQISLNKKAYFSAFSFQKWVLKNWQILILCLGKLSNVLKIK